MPPPLSVTHKPKSLMTADERFEDWLETVQKKKYFDNTFGAILFMIWSTISMFMMPFIKNDRSRSVALFIEILSTIVLALLWIINDHKSNQKFQKYKKSKQAKIDFVEFLENENRSKIDSASKNAKTNNKIIEQIQNRI